MSIGIDDMALYVPELYLDIHTLAEKRQIPYEKLSRGLGLHKMAICDAHEDAATMAAEAILELINRNGLNPAHIGRIYLGTESALDGSKPTATYAMEMVEHSLSGQWGPNCLRHCDALDMTFACIGAVDAMQNTIDWVAANPQSTGIVVASDIAKYELHSTGEYTQGAGAIAILIKARPRLLAIRPVYGVASESVHDFFKPRRERYEETPVFDGQYSNQCYFDRMHEALDDFSNKAVARGLFGKRSWPALSERWSRMIFHLPYAFHAKRIYVEQFILEKRATGEWDALVKKYGFQTPETMRFNSPEAQAKAQAALLKAVGESEIYQRFVKEKLEKAHKASQETGNLYTASIFLALMSSMEMDVHAGNHLAKKRIGFIAYGSGSKAKVFEGVVQSDYESVVRKFQIFHKLQQRKAISYESYLDLHTGKSPSLCPEKGHWGLKSIGKEGVTLGARYYHILT